MQDYATPLIALAGTVFGGAGLEITKRWLGRNKDKTDTATEIRSELRADLTAIKVELDKVEAELDTWKEKYYDVYSKYIEVKALYEEALRKITADAALATHQARNLAPPVDPPA